jgi:uncharacterized membrane protein (DUF4010 family)
MESLPSPPVWVPFESLGRLLLALGVGLFVGFEREWRKKEAGLRTFGLVALLGGMGGLLGLPYAVVSVTLSGVLVAFLNANAMRAGEGTELTTSAALLVTAMAGVLCGVGHRVTPVAVAVITTALLSWKEYLAEFGQKVTAEELRSAILLGILAFTVYPLLPSHPIDPWGMIVPRTAWLTVVLIAGIGFVNYVLWKIFGTRGIEFAGFLGGLVNSTVTVTELATRVSETKGALIEVAYRGVLLSIAAMAVRNAFILGLLQLKGLAVAGASLGLMLASSAGMALLARRPPESPEGTGRPFALNSPFSLRAALKFGVIFLALQSVGTIAQALFGRFGFYVVSFLGGLVSSASACAAAATLGEQGKISPAIAGIGVVLASLASAAVNVGLVARFSGSRALTRRVTLATAIVLVVGLAGAIVTERLDARSSVKISSSAST